jgi:hypothetical protein
MGTAFPADKKDLCYKETVFIVECVNFSKKNDNMLSCYHVNYHDNIIMLSW